MAEADALPNATAQIATRIAEGRIQPMPVWGMLLVRSVLAIGAQTCVFLAYLAAGASDPWRSAADWWLASFALAEFANLAMLSRLARREGLRYWDLLNLGGGDRRADVRWLVIALAVSGPVAMLPNILLGQALWGNAQVGADMSFRALPLAAAWALVFVFPVVHALTELPTYFGYVMPRLQAISHRRWRPLVVCALVLSAQHMFLPLLFDWRFIVWRAVMFVPFALWLAWVLDRRPTVMPYLLVGHALLDLSLPIYILVASY